LYDPAEIRRSRARFRRESLEMLQYANSLYCPTGRFPSKGWILLSRADYNTLVSFGKTSRAYGTSFQLQIDSLSPFTNLSIVQAQCVTRGLASDTSAIYLVEITDDRGVLWNKWFQAPTQSQYNIRSPAYPQGFYSASLNSGVPWTWNTMCQDLWNQMNSIAGGGQLLGAYPGLPITPTGLPENWYFPGYSAWFALCDIMDHLGLSITCDLTEPDPFGIVMAGNPDPAFAALQAKYGPAEEDLEWIDVGAGRVPAQVTVLFRKRNQFYGSEETVRADALQWSSSPYYQVAVSAPATFSNAVGVHYIIDDFSVQYDINGNPLASDMATAATIAAERVQQYFNKIYRQTSGFMNQTYPGALPFVTGSQVDGVCWEQDYSSGRAGWRTSVVRGVYPPWPDIWEPWTTSVR
jgi:hypothetical protein